MPKRACPFEDNLLPQLKVHVGQRQIDNGVSSDERMKLVYDKTLSLLKEGVKALSHKLNNSVRTDPIDLLTPKTSPCRAKPEHNLKQMILNKKLELELTDKIIDDIQADLCGCCRPIDRRLKNRCYYCDQILCSFCLLECANCRELFCQNCSLPVYETEERNMCLNCYQ